MKVIIGIIIRAVLGFFSARRDFAQKIKLKAKNKQLEKENAILSKQNDNAISDVNDADKLFKRLLKRRK